MCSGSQVVWCHAQIRSWSATVLPSQTVGRRADAVLTGLLGLRLAWRTTVNRSVAGTEQGRPLQHNPFGFVEGQGNPALLSNAADHVLLSNAAGPPWLAGGSYLALRVIRMAHGRSGQCQHLSRTRSRMGRPVSGSALGRSW